uniref:Uncharacterized protein n=1 Tax=Arcella intermedia TaxID=1963864 RepID=A0A6B2LVA6_9EUKA
MLLPTNPPLRFNLPSNLRLPMNPPPPSNPLPNLRLSPPHRHQLLHQRR